MQSRRLKTEERRSVVGARECRRGPAGRAAAAERVPRARLVGEI